MDSRNISTILIVIFLLLVITGIVLDFIGFNRARASQSVSAFTISAAAVTGIGIILMIIGAFLGGYGFFSIAPILLFISALLLIVSIVLDVVGENRAQKGDRKDAATALLFAGIFGIIAVVLVIIALIVHSASSSAEELANSPAGQNLLNTLAANPELLLV